MTTSEQIIEALNRFDETLRIAVRTDVLAECGEDDTRPTLKRLNKAWADCKAARIELVALIAELGNKKGE